jgi:hypothetical protein
VGKDKAKLARQVNRALKQQRMHISSEKSTIVFNCVLLEVDDVTVELKQVLIAIHVECHGLTFCE